MSDTRPQGEGTFAGCLAVQALIVIIAAIAFAVFMISDLAGADEAAAAAPAVKPPCSGQLSLWTPAEHSSQTHQWLQPAGRAEGICNLAFSLRGWGRGDLYALPGKAAPTDGSLNNVGAGEASIGISRVVTGPLSVAAFVVLHGSVSSGTLAGGVSTSLCGGLRADFGADYAVVGICDKYLPVGTGVPIAGTVSLPVKGVLGVATNFAWIPKTRDTLIAIGPTASWGR